MINKKSLCGYGGTGDPNENSTYILLLKAEFSAYPSSVRKQGAKKAGTQLAFLFLLSPGPQFLEWRFPLLSG